MRFKTLAFLAAITLIPSLHAAGEDNETTTPTAWRVRTNQSLIDIQAQSAAGYRPVDIVIRSVSPLRFDMTYVRNIGDHRKTWWMYHNKSFNEIASLVKASNRILRLTPYVTNGSVRFAALFVARTGADNKGWYWYANTSLATIMSNASQNGARPIDIDSYVVGNQRYYSAVLIKNSGDDARLWWYYANQTTSDISAKIAQHNAMVYDLDRRAPGRYDVVLTRPKASVSYWWYTGQSLSALDAKTEQNGARIFDLESYVENGSRRFTALMIQNTNALTTRIGRILRTGSDGSSGLLLREIGGSTRAALMTDFEFDPASTLKQLHGAFAVREALVDPQVSLNTSYQFFTGACPYNSNPVTEPLSTIIRTMLEQSNNPRTVAIERIFGKSKMHAMADALGMTSTRSNRLMGCSAPPYNTMTLNDVHRLHDAVAGGFLGNLREEFLDFLRNDSPNYPLFGTQRLSVVLAQERAKAGLANDEYAAFLARFRMAFKPGAKTIQSKRHQTISGWVSIPYRVGSQVVERQFVTGVFIHGDSNSTSVQDTVARAATELLRDELAKAMASYKGFPFGSFVAFGTSCVASGSTRGPEHHADGSPTLNAVAAYRLRLAPRAHPASVIIGGSHTRWGRTALPLSLDFLGATGCSLRVSPTFFANVMTDGMGTARVSLPIPNDGSLLGKHLYTQYAVLDRDANSFGLLLTNGIDTRVGLDR